MESAEVGVETGKQVAAVLCCLKIFVGEILAVWAVHEPPIPHPGHLQSEFLVLRLFHLARRSWTGETPIPSVESASDLHRLKWQSWPFMLPIPGPIG